MLKRVVKKIFDQTEKPWVFKLMMGIYPPYIGTGVRVNYVSDDFSEMSLEMPLRFYNKNIFGTQFGGSLYAMSDPFYCLMLSKILGKEYIVWDKGAKIDFVKPGVSTVSCKLTLAPEEIERIKLEARHGAPVYPVYTVEVIDASGVVVTTIEKQLYVRKKTHKYSPSE